MNNYVYACDKCEYKNEDFDLVSEHVRGSNCQDQEQEFEATSSASDADSRQQLSDELVEEIPNEENDSGSFTWNSESTKLLLLTRFEMESKFAKPKKKKKQLWEDVAKQMFTAGRYKVTGVTCDNKFRTLMTTYRKCKDKMKDSGSGTSTKWPYFEIIDEQYGVKAAVNPRPELIGSSLAQASKVEKETETVERTVEDEKTYDLEYFKKNENSKRQKVETTAQLYKKKMKQDDDRYKEDSVKKENRFQQRQATEEKKIEAVNRLTSVFEKLAEKLL